MQVDIDWCFKLAHLHPVHPLTARVKTKDLTNPSGATAATDGGGASGGGAGSSGSAGKPSPTTPVIPGKAAQA